MTLATVGRDGVPQAAALFYAHDSALNLYFLSEPTTGHGQNVAFQPHVAATIQADGQEWQKICGLQIEGTVDLVEGVAEMAHAARIYAARFAFLAGSLLGTGAGPLTLAGPLARSRFYVLRPQWMRLTDNRVRFGHKEEMGRRGQ